MSDFDVKNNIQSFLARTLSLVYAEVRYLYITYNTNLNQEKKRDTLYFKQFLSS